MADVPKEDNVDVEAEQARLVVRELGLAENASAWLSTYGDSDDVFLEVPFDAITNEANLRAYKYERKGNLILIDLTDLVKKDVKKMDFKSEFDKQVAKNRGIVKNDRSANIRDWYVATYPTDELGAEISPMTFESLWIYPEYAEQQGEKVDVYGVIGVGDSLVRERLFQELARIYNVPYERVYNRFFNRPNMCWT